MVEINKIKRIILSVDRYIYLKYKSESIFFFKVRNIKIVILNHEDHL